jgi:hypothetical protein
MRAKYLERVIRLVNVKWVHQHDMMYPHSSLGGDILQPWRIAVNILNKQSWAAEKR